MALSIALFNKFYSSESEYDECLKKFIEETVLNDKKNTPFYSTDGKTPIVHSNLEKMRKYGTENFLSKVLKGEKPADTPVNVFSTGKSVINKKLAQELGITIPESVLKEAGQVIE